MHRFSGEVFTVFLLHSWGLCEGTPALQLTLVTGELAGANMSQSFL